MAKCPSDRSCGQPIVRPASAPRAHERDEHGHALSIVAICVTQTRDEIAFLELDRDEDIDRCCKGEQQVRRGHGRCRPECEEPADVEWMTNQAIRARRPEFEGTV